MNSLNTNDEYVDYEEVKDDSSNKMDNNIRQSITNREDIYKSYI